MLPQGLSFKFSLEGFVAVGGNVLWLLGIEDLLNVSPEAEDTSDENEEIAPASTKYSYFLSVTMTCSLWVFL